MLSTNCIRINNVRLSRRAGSDLVGEIVADVQMGSHTVSYFFTAVFAQWEWIVCPGGFEPIPITDICIACLQSGTSGAQTWYAFSRYAERDLFIDFLRVDGIGPAAALKAISRGGGAYIRELIAVGDRASFIKIPGMTGKLGVAAAEHLFAKAPAQPDQLMKRGAALDDAAVAAMHVLGYDMKPAKAAVLQAQKNLPGGANTPTIVTEALRLMQK